jgi:transcriptional regulator with GAF, ATPase, and Fis domain
MPISEPAMHTSKRTLTGALEADDLQAALAAFRQDIVFRSPILATVRDEVRGLPTLLNEPRRGIGFAEVRTEQNFGDIIGASYGLRKVMKQIELVAPTDATVLITGESGTGKELVARAIHEHSTRSRRVLIKLNCSAVPEGLFESEFFGHVRGSFTGALKDKPGRFELADGGNAVPR